MSSGECAMQKARCGFPPGLPTQLFQIALFSMCRSSMQSKFLDRNFQIACASFSDLEKLAKKQ
jgi:hypothetical protein